MTVNDMQQDASSRAQAIQHSSIFLNALDSTRWHMYTPEYLGLVAAGGIDAVNVTVASETLHEHTLQEAIRAYARWRRRLVLLSPAVRIVHSVRDIEEAKRNRQLAVILGFQNTLPFEDDLDLVDVFARLGVRIVGLTYNRRNLVGDGCAESTDSGLSAFGLNLVARLNRLRLVIDLSHAGPRTALHAVEVSESPPVVTHTNMRAKCDHFRCIQDGVLKAVADRGGAVGITALSIFLREGALETGSSLDDYLRHLEYAIEVAGIDHVGIGFDVGYGRSDEDTVRLSATYPEFRFPPLHLRYCEQLNRTDKAQNLVHALIQRGYADADIAKILGGNFLRVFRLVWGGGQCG